MLIVSVSRYFGKTAVYIYDDNGCLVTSMSTFMVFYTYCIPSDSDSSWWYGDMDN